MERTGPSSAPRIAYLVNQYPAPSHSFIRREIQALERAGIPVDRFSIRPTSGALPDAGDREELEKTRSITSVGVGGLLLATLESLIRRPRRFVDAARTAAILCRRSPRGLLVHLGYLAESCVLAGWLRAAGTTHVHAHFATNSTTVAMLGAALAGCTYSFTIHGPTDFDLAPTLGLDVKIARASFVSAISGFCRSQAFRWCDPAHWQKIHIVRCGLDGAFLGHPNSPVPDVPRFVSIGRLSAPKGQILLVEGVAALVREGVDVRVVLIGDGELRGAIEARVAELGIGENLVLTGVASSSQVREQILASRAIVLPSFAEGLPVVLMESLALHRPAITTRITGIPELVEDGVNGWLITPGSVAELVKAMRRALDTPTTQLESMAAAGAAAVAERHDADREAQKLAGLFRGESPTEQAG